MTNDDLARAQLENQIALLLAERDARRARKAEYMRSYRAKKRGWGVATPALVRVYQTYRASQAPRPQRTGTQALDLPSLSFGPQPTKPGVRLKKGK